VPFLAVLPQSHKVTSATPLNRTNDLPHTPTTDPVNELRAALRTHRDDLCKLQEMVSQEWVSQDLIYRFWHHSFKVYALQDYTLKIAQTLESLAPTGAEMHPWFQEIISAGTGHVFDHSHNTQWVHHTLPIVNAFFHARHMLALTTSCVDEMGDAVPRIISSGFATLLELYQIR
jgi:hypothetical protein